MSSRAKDTGFLRDLISYDSSGNITLPALLYISTNKEVATKEYVDSQNSNQVLTSRTLSINGTTYDLSANRSWTINSMVYPPAGIPTSSGTGWGASITNNSANWNEAHSWGNHASVGYALMSELNTHELIENKSTNPALGTSNVLYPTQLAVKTYVDSVMTGGMLIQGDWNAATNTPNLSGTVTTGYTWRVSVAGSTNLGGITTWNINDLAVKTSGGWIKIDNSSTVQSVFGRQGIVVAAAGDYTTAQVTESGNLYYTDARARASITLTNTGTSGTATYNAVTGVLNIPIYQGGVTAFNTRTGAITLSSSDVTTALGYTPQNSSSAITTTNIGSQSVSYATTSGTANAVTWANVSGKPSFDYATHRGEGTNYVDYSRYVYNNGAYSGSGWTEPSDLGVRYANSAGSASSATNATNATYSTYINTDSYNMKLHWSGQSGQPTWLWGSNNGADAYVWNPSNFSVSYANSAGSAGSVAWGNVSGRPTSLSSFSNDVGYITGSYLPLSGGTVSGTITATAFYESSDIRYKTVLETNPEISGLGIDVIKFTRDGQDKIRYGYSAQQVKAVIPDAVEGTDNLVVNYMDVHTIKIASLERRVAELEAKLKSTL